MNIEHQVPPKHILAHEEPSREAFVPDDLHQANIIAIAAVLRGRRVNSVYKAKELGRGLTRYLFYVTDVIRLFNYWSEAISLCGRLEGPQSLIEVGRDGQPNQAAFVIAHGSRWKYGNLSSVVSSEEWKTTKIKVPLPLGERGDGRKVIADLSEMGSLGVFGTEGVGSLDYVLLGLLYRFRPHELKVAFATMGDRWSAYAGLPHLALPVPTEAREVIAVLSKILCEVMKRRTFIGGQEVSGSTTLPRLVVFISGVEKLTDRCFEKARLIISQIAKEGPEVGVNLVAYIPTPSTTRARFKRPLGFNGVLAFAMRGEEHSRIVLGDGRARGLFGQGDYLFRASAHGSFINGNMIYPTEVECGRVLVS